MRQIIFDNELSKEKKELLKKSIYSFFDGNKDDFFSGAINLESSIETGKRWDNDKERWTIVSSHLKIDIVKTNSRLTAVNPTEETAIRKE